MDANAPYFRIPRRDQISLSIFLVVFDERENSVISQGVMERALAMAIGGCDFEEGGQELPLISLKDLLIKSFPSFETLNGDVLVLFCLSVDILLLFVGTGEIEREMTIVKALFDEVNNAGRLVDTNQGRKDLSSRGQIRLCQLDLVEYFVGKILWMALRPVCGESPQLIGNSFVGEYLVQLAERKKSLLAGPGTGFESILNFVLEVASTISS